MWMGLTTKKTTTAVVNMFVFVIVWPWLVLMFLQGFAMGLLAFTLGLRAVFWSLGPVVMAAVNLGKDIFFIRWSRRKLLTRFRDTITRDSPLVVPRAPPPLPSVPKLPVIASATKP